MLFSGLHYRLLLQCWVRVPSTTSPDEGHKRKLSDGQPKRSFLLMVLELLHAFLDDQD